MIVRGPKGEEICAIHSGVSNEQISKGRASRNVALANGALIAELPKLLLCLGGLADQRIVTNAKYRRMAHEHTKQTMKELNL